jgi:hypothetical protein
MTATPLTTVFTHDEDPAESIQKKIISCRTKWEAICIDNADFSDSKMSRESTYKHSLFP